MTACMVAASLLSAVPAQAADGRGQGAPATGAADSLSLDQASAQARTSGKPVPVPDKETATSTLTAEPNGTLQLAVSPQPVRKKVGGTWKNLDGVLKKNSDGTLSTTISTNALMFSGGEEDRRP